MTVKRKNETPLPLAESLRLLSLRADWQTAGGFVYFEGDMTLARVFSPRGQRIARHTSSDVDTSASGIRKLPGWASRMIIVENA